ncbi:MAG: hypothetical protein Q8N63_00420 [Nanoarchaeota archaeon]|nr:hypothetical protein [Nanoarchaeota archaeon]
MRKAFIKTLEDLTEKDRNIFLLTADIGFGVLEPYIEKYPDNFFNFGIGEANTVGIATGMALKGKIPAVYTINSFLVFRAFEQIRMLSYMGTKEKLHCILVGTGLADEYTNQGISHYANGDLQCLETLPLTILTPKNKTEVSEMLKNAYEKPGIYYMRLSRFGELDKRYENK